jgi:hypothetical protein
MPNVWTCYLCKRIGVISDLTYIEHYQREHTDLDRERL